MNKSYTRIQVTDLLLQNGYKPVVTKESSVFDIYEKRGAGKVRLLSTQKVFSKELLSEILPKELIKFI